jgi:hypothetical protein
MPGRYVPVNNRGFVNYKVMGGAIPLLGKVATSPIKGGDIDGKTNKPVGIISPAPQTVVLEGGKLLQNIRFGSNVKKGDKQERIKFIF